MKATTGVFIYEIWRLENAAFTDCGRAAGVQILLENIWFSVWFYLTVNTLLLWVELTGLKWHTNSNTLSREEKTKSSRRYGNTVVLRGQGSMNSWNGAPAIGFWTVIYQSPDILWSHYQTHFIIKRAKNYISFNIIRVRLYKQLGFCSCVQGTSMKCTYL